MRALVVMSGLADGGGARVAVAFLQRLVEYRDSVVACTVRNGQDGPIAAELAEAGIPRRNLGARRLADPIAAWRLHQLIRRERVDVVHAHGQDAAVLCAAARCVNPTPLAITRYELDDPKDTPGQRLQAMAIRAAFRRADMRIAVSAACAKRLAELGRFDPGTIRVIRTGIDVDRWRTEPFEDARAALGRELGFGPEHKLVLVPAPLRHDKGHEVLLAALPRLQERVPGIRLLLVGVGERAGALRRMTAGLGDAVVLLGHRPDLPRVLAASDLVVLPSRSEALPTVLMAAAAAGRPVVATRVGGTAEVVEDGRTGTLVRPGDPAGLADAVAWLLLDPARAAAMGSVAAAVAAQRFGLDRQVAETWALWRQLARRSA